MTGLDLDAIEARANAATAGPWFPIVPADETTEWFDPYDDPMVVTSDSNPGNYCAIAQDISNGKSDGASDAAFIAAARTDVPALVAEVRRFQPVTFPDGSQVFMHACHHTEWWNEQEHGPINDQGCDACESAPFTGGWQPVYLRRAGQPAPDQKAAHQQ